jgi:hypothetical protein
MTDPRILLSTLAGTFGVHLRADDPAAPGNFTGLCTHNGITPGFAAPVNATMI